MKFSELAPLLSGTWRGEDHAFKEVSTDTRTLQPGQLYFALRGENFDGHEFANQAVASGACGAVVSRSVEALPQIQVEDTTRALGTLGKWNRLQSDATVIAVTGSQGKTTVKEMIGSILRVRHQVLVTRGNLNNDIGVPLTLLQLSQADQYAVVELGASAGGEIAYTVSLVLPRIVVLNNAGSAHLEGFGSVEGVIRAKGEIIDGAADDGVVVLNADHASLAEWRSRAGRRTVRTFSAQGVHSGADHYADDVQLDAIAGSNFRLVTPEGSAMIALALPGLHNVANATAAAAAALAAGATLDDVQTGLGRLVAVAGRLRTVTGLRGATVIDDSYNASPESFRAAIDVLAACKGRRVLVVGDMAELGAGRDEAHEKLGCYARQMQIDELWSVGDASAATARSFGNGLWFEDHAALIAHAAAHVGPDMTLLVKGSRSSRMDLVVAQLSEGDH